MSIDDVFTESGYQFSAGAEYIVGYGLWLLLKEGRLHRCFEKHELPEMNYIGLDTFRSIMDNQRTIFMFDVELYSGIDKHKFKRDPALTYKLLDPLNAVVLSIAKQKYDIDFLSIATTQGFQYLCGVDREKSEHHRLEQIGQSGIRADMEDVCYNLSPGTRRDWLRRRPVFSDEIAGWIAMGKLAEFLAHQVIWTAGEIGYQMPINIGDVKVNTDFAEGVNLDLSCYEASPHMRDHRLPFSTHQKLAVEAQDFNLITQRAIPVNIPAHDDKIGSGFHLSYDDNLRIRHDSLAAAHYASNLRMEIPEQAWGIMRLLDDYYHSNLFQFHTAFDNSEANPSREIWNLSSNYKYDDLLNPTVVRGIVNNFFNMYNGNPAVARQLATALGTFIKENHYCDWDCEKYPPEFKMNFWVRAYWGQRYCGMHF